MAMSWQDIGAASAFMMVIVTIVIYLHTRATNRSREVEAKIDEATARADAAHRAIAAQLADMSLSIAENYVRKDDLRESLSTINTNIVGTQAAIAEIRQLFYRRPRGEC